MKGAGTWGALVAVDGDGLNCGSDGDEEEAEVHGVESGGRWPGRCGLWMEESRVVVSRALRR